MNRKITFLLVVFLAFVLLGLIFNSGKEGYGRSSSKASRRSERDKEPDKEECFSGDSIIHLEGNVTKQIKDAEIGDKILSYSMHQNKFVYSPIVAIPHETNNTITQFVEIETSNGNKLKLTPDHFIPIMKSTDVAFGLISAKEVCVGDTVITVNGRETVTSVSNIDCEGAYTVITLEEFIVVNNVVASPYAIFHFLGNVYYSIHKVLYKTNPDIVKHQIFGKVNKHAEQFYSKTIGIYKNLVKAQ